MNRVYKRILGTLALCILFIAVMPALATAQKKGGGAAPAKVQKPAAQKPAANVQKPAAQKPAANVQKPAAKAAPTSNQSAKGKLDDRSPSKGDGKASVGDNKVGNKTNVGNKVNVDNSKKNVNVNIDNSKDIKVNNSRNTSVRHTNNYRPYSRPPYRYGGYRYNCYHPYYYHPYRPFVWGPMWHPWGFFIATLATTAIIVSLVDNDLPDLPVAYEMHTMGGGYYADDIQPIHFGRGETQYHGGQGGVPYALAGDEYYFDEGVFYLKGADGYTVVAGPVGGTVSKLPSGFETIKLDDGTTNYYYAGTFFEKTSKGYTVVPPTAGAVVANLPDGGEEVELGDVKYVKLGEIYFQPIQQDGKSMYEIASVEEDK